MFRQELKEIEINGVKYPYKCDFNVLEHLEAEFGNVINFENKLKSKVETEQGTAIIPDTKATLFALTCMIDEGIYISEKEIEMPSKKLFNAMISDEYSIFEIYEIVSEEFNKCFERKKELTTQTKK